MKIKEDYILREIMGDTVLIPVGKTAVEDNSITIMTETGGFIVRQLQQGKSRDEIVEALLEEYEVTRPVAEQDCDEFIDMLRQNNLLDE